ncbi:MAG: hypothetical protein ABSG05_03475 [Candidatus Pacearchaeota archaeon]
MSYGKAKWNPYGDLEGYNIEISIRDSANNKIDHYRIYNENQYQAVLKEIKNKYGLKYPIEIKEVEKKQTPLTMTATQIKIEAGIEETEKKTQSI